MSGSDYKRDPRYWLVQRPLWGLTCFFWMLPSPLCVLGNRISDWRFNLYTKYGWEWI